MVHMSHNTLLATRSCVFIKINLENMEEIHVLHVPEGLMNYI